MAITSRLLQLFGWRATTPPRDKPRKGEDPEMGMQYGSNPYQQYQNTVKPPYDRRRKYDIYDELDELPIMSSVLDAYAEDASQHDREHKAIVWLECDDAEAKKVGEELFKRLHIEEYVQSIARDVGKYGDDFALLDIEGDTIQSWDWLDPRDIERMENNQGVLVGFEKTELLQQVIDKFEKASEEERAAHEYTFKPWDIVHFRQYKRKREPRQKYRNVYGTSIFAGSERIGKMMKIMDDMLMVRRLTKTLDTRVYEVDTGRSDTEQELLILKRWRNAMKRKPFVDPTNARFDSMFDPFTWQEDVFWSKRADSQSSVQVIAGQPNVSDIVDIEHFRDQLFGSLRAPKGYFGFEGDINAKATLSAQDMKWGRAVNGLQASVKQGLKRLVQIQLALKNMNPYTKINICMVVPSVLEDLSRLEAMQILIDVSERMATLGETLQLDKKEWRNHILRTALGLSDEEVERFSVSDDYDSIPDITGDDDKPLDSPDGPPATEKQRTALTSAIESALAKIAIHRQQTADTSVPWRIHEDELPTKATMEKRNAKRKLPD